MVNKRFSFEKFPGEILCFVYNDDADPCSLKRLMSQRLSCSNMPDFVLRGGRYAEVSQHEFEKIQNIQPRIEYEG